MVGWKDGAPNGTEAYDALTEELFIENFDYASGGDSMEAMIPIEAIGVSEGDSISLSAFQEGASNDWQVDWLNPTTLEFMLMSVESEGKVTTTWAKLKVY